MAFLLVFAEKLWRIVYHNQMLLSRPNTVLNGICGDIVVSTTASKVNNELSRHIYNGCVIGATMFNPHIKVLIVLNLKLNFLCIIDQMKPVSRCTLYLDSA